jgi:hypothetical protein
MEKFGFTVEHVVERAHGLLGKHISGEHISGEHIS